MNRLVGLVEGLVTSNVDLQNRINALAMDQASLVLPSTSTSTGTEPLSQSSISDFEIDLNMSRPYRRLRPREFVYSISSSQRGSMALSAFSDLTLGNISIISVLCLPIWSTDLRNAEHYRFGKDGLDLTMAEVAQRYPDIEFPTPDRAFSFESSDESIDGSMICHDSSTRAEDLSSDDQTATLPQRDRIKGSSEETRSENLRTIPLPPTPDPTPIAVHKALNIQNKDATNHERTMLSFTERKRLQQKAEDATLPRTGGPRSKIPPGRNLVHKPRPIRFPTATSDEDEPEVLFLAASLFLFDINRDRREKGIPYLIYDPGEVSGCKSMLERVATDHHMLRFLKLLA